MKKILLPLLLLAGFCSLSTAQITIFEDFDSYAVGDDIVDVNPTYFEYWPGGSLGLEISDVQAASGANSVYLFSNTGGGPADVIMNFQDKYDSGTASLSFKMFVSPDHGAYFNIQAEETAGSIWASNVSFFRNGTVEFSNSDNTVAASAIYPQGEWFEISYNVNLDENIWELSLDGKCLASYANPENAFASMNLYPFSGSGDAEFWFDDIRFEHSPDAQEITRDVGLILGNDPLGGLEGNSISNVAAMINNVGEEITSANFEVDYAGSTIEIKLEDISVPVGDTLEIVTDSPIDLVSGIEEILVKLTSVNGVEGDDVVCNNSLFAVTTAVSPAPRKAVLVEEGTGTWCGWCPRGAVFMERMEEKYGELFVGIAVHNGDVMTVAEYDDGITSTEGFTGFPGAIVDRNIVLDPSGIETPFLESIVAAPRGAFEMGADLDSDNNLDISINVESLSEVYFADNVFVAIFENGVTGTGSDYAQQNYYADGNSGMMGGYENLPAVVPADQMVYEEVARAIVTPYEGVDVGVETILSAGDSRLLNFKYTLDDAWNLDNLYIVAVLLDTGGAANNAMKISLTDALANGFVLSDVNDPTLQASFEVFPNPTADLMNVKLESPETGDVKLELFNIYGQTMKTERLQSFTGVQNWVIDVSDLPNGIYSTRVTIGNNTAVKTIQKFSN